MKLRLLILLAAAALSAAPASGQTIKSLGFNTSNGVVPTTALSNLPLTFTNTGGISGSSFDSGNVLMGSNTVTFYGTNSGLAFSAGANASQIRNQIGLGATWLTNTDVTNFRTAIGLGATNFPTFRGLEIVDGDALYINPSGINADGFGGELNFEERKLVQAEATVFAWATNSFAVTPAATFSTNVSVAGSLSVGSLTTTTPSTWALDATQTAAATNGVLALPSNANVIRLTNNNAISSVTNGILGAFYYLVNQATNAVTISNVGGITIDGAQNLTLSPNESATLVATGPTNVSVAARGDLTDVALGGTANTAPSQTASSGASLMTRDLGDTRYGGPVLLSKLTSDVSYTNDSTGTTILSVTFPSDGAYEVNQLVRFTANSANSKVSLSGSSAGTAFSGYREYYNNGSSPARVVGLKNSVGTGGSYGDTFNTDNHGRHGVIIAFSGATLQIAAAQNTNSTNVTTVGSGSYLSVRRLSADSAW